MSTSQRKKKRIERIFSVIAIVFIIYLCYWCVDLYLVQFSTLPGKDAVISEKDPRSVWGTFGDYIGGIIGTLLGFLSIVLLFITFKAQRRTSEREKFEAKYYELIKLHRDNVSELVLGQETGKKIFVQLLREFRIARLVIDDVLAEFNMQLERQRLMELTYLVLFYGTGPNSNRVLRAALPDYQENFVQRLQNVLHTRKAWAKQERNFKFTPFEGHQSRLGHYYRHLFQSISYVHTRDFLTPDEKREYVKTIRAQLSNHEQAMLFLNSITRIGQPWRDKRLIVEYELIKNIPQDFLAPARELNIKEVFPEIEFEYEEILGRVNTSPISLQTMPTQQTTSNEKYNTAVQLLLFKGQMLWQIMGAFLIVNTILLGFIAKSYADKSPSEVSNDSLYLCAGVIGLIQVIAWLGTFMRNSKYYHFRMEQAKAAEDNSQQLLQGQGEAFAEGKKVSVNNVTFQMNWFERLMRNKRAGFLLIGIFGFVYIIMIILHIE